MSTPQPNLKKILFVDDSQSSLNMMEKVFASWHGNTWQFLRAPSIAKALPMLDGQVVDLIVLEPETPGLDGLQTLQLLNQRFAALPKVILTRKPDPAARDQLLQHGASLYLTKPSNMEEMETVYAALNELMKWRPAVGFLGLMWCASLSEVLQIECINQSSAVLEIVSGASRGKVYIRSGTILHAHADHHKGTMALAYLLTFKAGEFYVKPFTDPPEMSVNGPWEALLMEAAQTRDEEGTAYFRRPRPSSEIEHWEETGVPPVSPTAELLQTAPEGMFIPKTEELLVCSAEGKLLYEWQSPESQLRCDFIRTLSEGVQELTHSLGTFDRLEIKGEDFRILVRLKNDNHIFARIHRPVFVSS